MSHAITTTIAVWAFVAGFQFAKWDSAHGRQVGYQAADYVRIITKRVTGEAAE